MTAGGVVCGDVVVIGAIDLVDLIGRRHLDVWRFLLSVIRGGV